MTIAFFLQTCFATRRLWHAPARWALVLGLCAAGLAQTATPVLAAPTDPPVSAQFAGAPWFRPSFLYNQNFPDPDVVYDSTSNTYFAFATTTGGVNMPVMSSPDLVSWTARSNHSIVNTAGAFNDGLPNPAPPDVTWETGDRAFPHPIWAPGVAKISGRWVAFYAVGTDASGRHCIAYATSDVPQGPYLNPHSLVCASDPMGSIDPKPFSDPETGITYLVWKDQGRPNVYGQRLWARAITMTSLTSLDWAAGSTPTLLFESSGSWEGYSSENPSLVRMNDRGLGLFWSGGEWDSDTYAVGFAKCPELTPSFVPVCQRQSEAPVMSRRQGEKGIGGSAAFRGRGGQLFIADHFWDETKPASYPQNQRFLVVDRVDEFAGRLVFSHEPGPTSQTAPAGFSPITPVRVLDTRDGTGTTMVRRTEPSEVFVVDVSSDTSASASAVTVNVTITDPAAPGFATVFECGTPPLASNVNFAAGATVPNLATVRLNDARRFCVLTSTAVHLVVDLQGEWSNTSPTEFAAVAPTRLVDTRLSGQRLQPGGRLEVQVTNRANIASGATAALVALTSDGAATPGFLTAWSCDGPAPAVSNVNHQAGAPSTNTALVPLSSRGTLCVMSLAQSDVIVDVFRAITAGGRPLTVSRPQRAIDTRDRGVPVAALSTLRVPVAAVGTKAASITVTAVDPNGPSWVAVFACDAVPARGAETSVLNVQAGETRAAHAVVPLDQSGAVCVRTLATMHLIVDRSGTLTGK